MPIKPGGPGSPPDDYNDAIQELGELISELPDRLVFKIAMAFSKGLVAAHYRGRQEAIDEARTATASQPSGGDSHDVGYPMLEVPDSLKMLRETLCVAQSKIGNSPRNEGRKREHVDRLQRLIDECDRHRPLGPDGKHGDRHTPTCGCEDVPSMDVAPQFPAVDRG